MPVTGGKRVHDVSQRDQYAKGGVGRRYWDYRDRVALSYVAGPRILDAGCGEGITLEKVIKGFADAEVEGVDIDPQNVAVCRKHELPVTRAGIYDLPYENACFDTCLLMEVIEHLDHPDKALTELARVTRPGGQVVVVYPVDWAWFVARLLCLRFKEAFFDPGHVRQWTARALARLMQQCGLRPVACRCLPLWPPFMLHGLLVGQREV